MGEGNYVENALSNKDLINLIDVIGSNFSGGRSCTDTNNLLFKAMQLLDKRVSRCIDKEGK